MAEFSANVQGFDPYQNFKFRMKWDGRYVAGVSKVTNLKRTIDPIKHHNGCNPRTIRKYSGQIRHDPITLERGLTHDVEFEQWANRVWNFGSGLGIEVSLKNFCKNITIEVDDEAGKVALAFKVYRCWVSECQTLPDLDTSGKTIAI